MGQTNLLQGTLDLLVLKALALGELHGLGISRRITDYARDVSSEAGIAVSGAAPDGGGWVAEGFLGRVGEQSQGEVLPADQGWRAAVGGGDGGVGKDCHGNGECVEGGIAG